MVTALLPFFFLFTISTTLPSASAQVVVDKDGEILQNNGGAYFIVSESGRGLELAKIGTDIHPISVVQSATNNSNGLPLRVSSPARVTFIRVGWRVNIRFVGVTPSYWRIVDESVKIGELQSVFGPFEIGIHEDNVYKILYCSKSDSACEPLRISPDDGHLSLVNGDLLLVQFKKAIQGSSTRSIA